MQFNRWSIDGALLITICITFHFKLSTLQQLSFTSYLRSGESKQEASFKVERQGKLFLFLSDFVSILVVFLCLT